MLKGKKILLGITGSIAAYKSIILVRLLIKAGAEVKVVMTPAARDFVSPLTLATLSKNNVESELFKEDAWANHVKLGRWADIMLIAPASCNSIAKMASGLCDNLLLAVYLSAACPVFIAPAMDEDMWHHQATRKNLQQLQAWHHKVIPVDKGELASGLTGEGRMAEPEDIVEILSNHFFAGKKLQGKKVLVTAGPTFEPIDPVRFIGNHSSGQMGIALATAFKKAGADVTLVCGPVQMALPADVDTLIQVQTAHEMYNACQDVFNNVDIAVMAAAVADFTPMHVADTKIKKQQGSLNLELTKTKDILKDLGLKKSNQILVGFALETDNEEANAQKKLKEKNADLIVLNSLQDQGAGFGHSTNKITIFEKNGNLFQFETKSKQEVATDIVNTVIDLYYA